MTRHHSGRFTLRRVLVLAGCLALCRFAQAQSINTVAGGGTDDGRPATLVGLYDPTGVAFDAVGNLYIADTNSYRVRRVEAGTGIITTVAGFGTQGFSGDGGPATAAQLDTPRGVAVDAAGNVYIADYFNNRIRKVAVGSGIITTVAGSGFPGFSGDGGQATAAGLFRPNGIALDASGNLYLTDEGYDRIRKVNAATGIITTVAGSGFEGYAGDGGPATAARLHEPQGIALDASGNLYIADSENGRIRKVEAVSGLITTVAGGGLRYADDVPATSTALPDPKNVAADESGNLYVSDTRSNRVRRVDAATGIISRVAGGGGPELGDGGPATAAFLPGPNGVALGPAANLYVACATILSRADEANDRIRKVDLATGVISTAAGNGTRGFSGDGGPSTAASLFPHSVAFDGSGNVYIADYANHRIRKVDSETGAISTVAGSGAKGSSGDGGPATAASLNYPYGVAADAPGNLYIADTHNDRVRKVDSATGIISTIAKGLALPGGVAVDSSGDVYIADTYNGVILKVDAASGTVTTAAAPDYSSPRGVAVDPLGNLYIADGWEVLKVEAGSGIVTRVAGNGTGGFSGDGGPATAAALYSADSVALDAAGNLYIADAGVGFAGNHRIRRVDAETGIISTVAGNGVGAFSGDGGPATAAALRSPTGVAFDASGNLYIADRDNRRVRVVFDCREIEPPLLSSPANGSSGIDPASRLAWEQVRGAFRYDVVLDQANPPKNVVAADIETAFYATSNLEPLTTYYWKVIAKGDPFCVPYRASESEVRSFTTANVCDFPAVSVEPLP